MLVASGPAASSSPWPSGWSTVSQRYGTEFRAGLTAEWLIELGTDGFTWRHGHEKATVALRGPLADVLRVFYRRLPADSERVGVLGEAAVLDFWLERVSLR
jgi:hypothetical protein